ncbi:MAG: Uma2 family endonuclease [Dehalococcoidia bacterium]
MATERQATYPYRMSWEQYLDWLDEDTLAEWIDGEVLLTSPDNEQNDDINGFLLAILRAFVETNDLGRVFGSRFLTRLSRSGRQPDVMVVLTEHLDRLERTFLLGPPDLAIEIVSPESQRRDRVEKLREYEQAGIPECWLLDPERRDATFFVLGSDGRYLPAQTPGGVFESRVLAGLKLPVEWCWSPPPLLTALRRLEFA